MYTLNNKQDTKYIIQNNVYNIQNIIFIIMYTKNIKKHFKNY